MQHEFTTIPGVVEDVTDICLNIKSLVVKMSTVGTKTLRIERHERGVVTGADVITDDQVEVINKDLVIATMTDDVPLHMELTVTNGRGYVPASEHYEQDPEVGVIPLDATFSPVVRVRYKIEDTRVGQRTNYDKLTMEIWTDGTVSPEMALVEAAKILRKHLNPFISYREPGPEIAPELGLKGMMEATGYAAGRSRTGRKARPKSRRTESLGAGHQLSRVRGNQYGARPRLSRRRAVAAGSQLRRNDAAGSSRALEHHRAATWA